MLSKRETDPKFSVSKWTKYPVLLDNQEMEACFKALPPFEIYNVSRVAPLENLTISHEDFLKAYAIYISDLKSGKIPDPDRAIFSSVFSTDPESVYAKEISPGRWMAKLAKPVVQLQHHKFFVSKIDHKIHSMVMSPESISWGIQFAFPQIFFGEDGYMKTSSELFTKLVKWLRAESVPTTFIFEGEKISSPIRLGKGCFAWIANHPQLIEQGVKVHVY